MSQEPLYRCVMVTTGEEGLFIHLLQTLGLGEGVCPKKNRIRFIQGKWQQDVVSIFPGYVFIRHEEPVELSRLWQTGRLLRILRYDSEPEGYLQGRDLQWAAYMFTLEKPLDLLDAVQEGSFVRITDGLLKNLGGTVISVNHRKRLAKIQVEFMNEKREVYLNYRILETVDAAPREESPLTEQEIEAEVFPDVPELPDLDL